jgi:hypothetical protein
MPPPKSKPNLHLPVGVFANATGTFRAKCQRYGKNYYLGTYKTIEEAEEAYKSFATLHPHGSSHSPRSPNPPKSQKDTSYDNLRAAWNSIFL